MAVWICKFFCSLSSTRCPHATVWIKIDFQDIHSGRYKSLQTCVLISLASLHYLYEPDAGAIYLLGVAGCYRGYWNHRCRFRTMLPRDGVFLVHVDASPWHVVSTPLPDPKHKNGSDLNVLQSSPKVVNLLQASWIDSSDKLINVPFWASFHPPG